MSGRRTTSQIVMRWLMLTVCVLLSSVACLPQVEPATEQVLPPTRTPTLHPLSTDDQSLDAPTEAPVVATSVTTTPVEPTLASLPGQILYMLAETSDEYGYSENDEGYVYTVAVNDRGTPLHPPTLLAGTNPPRWGRLYPAPDGSLVALVDPDFNGDLIYLLNPLTGGIQRLFGDSPNPGARFFGWHPDSRQVLLWTIGNSLRLADVASGQYITYIDDTNDMNNSFLGGIHAGVVAANGQIIYSHRGIEPSLWMIRNSFDERTPPTELSPCNSAVWQSGGFCVSEPQLLYKLAGAAFTLSPDGQKVAFYGVEESSVENRGLMVMNANGSDLQLLSHNMSGRYPASLVWSPDGRTIAFRADAQTPGTDVNDVPVDFQNMTIHLIDVATGEERPLLTAGSTGHIDPTWSPDGSQIAFASMRSGRSEIWVVNADGTNLQQLTDHRQFARYPVWLKQPDPQP